MRGAACAGTERRRGAKDFSGSMSGKTGLRGRGGVLGGFVRRCRWRRGFVLRACGGKVFPLRACGSRKAVTPDVATTMPRLRRRAPAMSAWVCAAKWGESDHQPLRHDDDQPPRGGSGGTQQAQDRAVAVAGKGEVTPHQARPWRRASPRCAAARRRSSRSPWSSPSPSPPFRADGFLHGVLGCGEKGRRIFCGIEGNQWVGRAGYPRGTAHCGRASGLRHPEPAAKRRPGASRSQVRGTLFPRVSSPSLRCPSTRSGRARSQVAGKRLLPRKGGDQEPLAGQVVGQHARPRCRWRPCRAGRRPCRAASPPHRRSR